LKVFEYFFMPLNHNHILYSFAELAYLVMKQANTKRHKVQRNLADDVAAHLL